jgi:hypothetical protein
MINGFDLLNWNYNDDSDLSLFILPDDSIDMIKDEYSLMTHRLRHWILKASPPCKNLMPSWNNQESWKKSTPAILQNIFSLSKLSHSVDNGGSGSLVASRVAWQWRRWWQKHGGSGSGDSLVATRRRRRQHGGSVAVAAGWQQQRGSMVAAAASLLRDLRKRYS